MGVSMHEIRLVILNGAWHADMSDADGAAEIRELFGTCLLETPFLVGADVDDVAATIRELNPGHLVTVRS